MQVKQSTSFRVPVRLVNAQTGAGSTGVTFSQPVVYIQKQAGSSALKSLGGLDWFELDATNMPGVYDLLLSTTDTNTVGFFKYAVAFAGAETYFGVVEIVANLVSDVVSTLGTTAGASVSADIAAVKANTTSINSNVDTTVSSRAPASTALSTAQWTNARAADIDNLDAAVSSRAASATALSTAQWTNGRASNLDNLDATISGVNTTLVHVLGLLKLNSLLDNQVYDGDGHLTSARLRIWDSAAHCTAAGGTGLLFTHTITATYSGGLCNFFQFE